MKNKVVSFAACFLLVSGCATAPKSPSEKVAYHLNQAREAINTGNCVKASYETQAALYLETGDKQVRDFFANNERARDCYFGYISKAVADISVASETGYTFNRLNIIKSAGVFTEKQTVGLFGACQEFCV